MSQRPAQFSGGAYNNILGINAPPLPEQLFVENLRRRIKTRVGSPLALPEPKGGSEIQQNVDPRPPPHMSLRRRFGQGGTSRGAPSQGKQLRGANDSPRAYGFIGGRQWRQKGQGATSKGEGPNSGRGQQHWGASVDIETAAGRTRTTRAPHGPGSGHQWRGGGSNVTLSSARPDYSVPYFLRKKKPATRFPSRTGYPIPLIPWPGPPARRWWGQHRLGAEMGDRALADGIRGSMRITATGQKTQGS